ncbi:hypothetical protein PIB30_097804, partial [Stylosanthes scabra]|nr:hypothetical protein [Stylosanthes scabra]
MALTLGPGLGAVSRILGCLFRLLYGGFGGPVVSKCFSLTSHDLISRLLVFLDLCPMTSYRYIKVNCDASIFHERQLVGFGCVLRDAVGSWILGCSGHLPIWSIFRCQLLVVWNGLRLAWEAGCKN